MALPPVLILLTAGLFLFALFAQRQGLTNIKPQPAHYTTYGQQGPEPEADKLMEEDLPRSTCNEEVTAMGQGQKVVSYCFYVDGKQVIGSFKYQYS